MNSRLFSHFAGSLIVGHPTFLWLGSTWLLVAARSCLPGPSCAGFTRPSLRRFIRTGYGTPNLDDNSDSNNSDGSPFSSTVMRTARSRPNLEWVVDDLIIRLRCISPEADCPSRTHPLTGLTDEPHLGALLKEARIWWLSNELGQLDASMRRLLMDEVIDRDANDAILAALGLFGCVAFPELNLNDVARMQTWYESPSMPPRILRDALALRVLAPWFGARPPSLVTETLEAWYLPSSPGLLRAALVVSVGLAHQPGRSHLAPIERALECLPVILRLGGSDVDAAAGWLLSSLWPLEPTLVEDWIAHHADALTRKVFRIAVGRMPTPIRVQLTDLWKGRFSPP